MQPTSILAQGFSIYILKKVEIFLSSKYYIRNAFRSIYNRPDSKCNR